VVDPPKKGKGDAVIFPIDLNNGDVEVRNQYGEAVLD